MYTYHVNRLDTAARAKIVKCLCEGNSLRATSRLLDCALNTVIKLVKEVGTACADYHHANVKDLDSKVVQLDEIWSFVGSKAKNTSPEKKAEGLGDAWTWVALDSDSKLIITYHIGLRSDDDGVTFLFDLERRLKNRIQLSSDGHGAYQYGVRLAFAENVDFGIVIKKFGVGTEAVGRYSPAICTGCLTKSIIGNPEDKKISTSHVERQNLNIRMGCRRYTRLTNAFSKRLESHVAAFSMYTMHYNFCRPHQTLTKMAKHRIPTSPAMAAGLTDHVWTVEELLTRVEPK